MERGCEVDRRDLTISAIRYLNLRTKGHINSSTDNIMVSCPIHGKDKNPSCGINLNKGIYHCFACGAHGSIEQLFKVVTGDDLYKVLGIKNDPFLNYARQKDLFEVPETRLEKLNTNIDRRVLSGSFRATSLRACLRFLRKRGISDEVANAMDIRYSDSIMINGRDFGKRILIPIYEDGKLISIEGRRIDDNLEPKVLYPKNSSVNTLYDWDNLNKDEPIYCTEGLMDMAVLRRDNTFKNSTCVFGACITNRQKELIKRCKKFIFIVDLDEPGMKVLDTLRTIQKGNIYYLLPPKQLNGVKLKDIGDLPKAGLTVTDLLSRKWLSYVKYLE